MQISVKSDVDKALKSMRGLQRKQVPFAAALGLSMTAKKVAKVEQRMMVRELDRPTPFTIKGVRWQGASKSDFKTGRLHSRVYLMSTQAEYLRYQIECGTIGQSGLKLLVAYESSTQYQPRFDFYGIAQRSVRTNIAKESAIASSYCIFHGTSPFLTYKRGR